MISECSGWTSRTRTLSDTEEICIKIKPSILPEGEEDMTKVFIGRHEKQDIEAFLWRTKEAVYINNKNMVFLKEIPFKKEEEVLSVSFKTLKELKMPENMKWENLKKINNESGVKVVMVLKTKLLGKETPFLEEKWEEVDFNGWSRDIEFCWYRFFFL